MAVWSSSGTGWPGKWARAARHLGRCLRELEAKGSLVGTPDMAMRKVFA